MREILFKAKRIDNGEWVFGNYAFCDCYTKQQHYIFQNKPLEFAIDETTICQYTVLTDKNGNKIWENDIMVAHFDDIYPEDESYTQVIWYQNGFYTKEKMSPDREPLDDFDSQNYTVCGNIFDNAELLDLVREV